MTTDEGIRLRPVQPGDLPRLCDMQLDPESNRMAGTMPRIGEAFDAHWARVLADPAVTARAILLGEVLVGYSIDRVYWGRGIAGRALGLLLREVVRRPLFATTDAGNGASLRVLRKCGFVVEEVRLSPATDRFLEREVAVMVLR